MHLEEISSTDGKRHLVGTQLSNEMPTQDVDDFSSSLEKFDTNGYKDGQSRLVIYYILFVSRAGCWVGEVSANHLSPLSI